MTQHTCAIDGKPAHRKAKLGEGYWCHACYEWSRKRGWVDPSQRERHRTAVQGDKCTVEGCDRPHKAKGFCGDHYMLNRTNGSPLVRQRRRKGSIRKALMEATAGASDDCMFFEGRQERHAVGFEGEVMQVSRAAWTARNGHPGALHVLHACNGGSGDHGCINLRHLYLGDHGENMTDKVEAGNSGAGVSKNAGEESPNALLTDSAVRDARAAWVKGSQYPHPGSTRSLALRFGVSQAAMKDALIGRRWVHVK